MNERIFKVGGCVRDTILGLKPKDIDFAVEAPSFNAMRELIIGRGGKIFLETPEFFTIRANVPEFGSADFVLCRKDGVYLDGRHPESVEVGTIEDDLARRDFTINAMAINTADGNMIDPHDGIGDCRRKVIRCVGNPLTRFGEDKLRVFRAVRFAITKGFTIEANTLQAIREIACNIHAFNKVSTERIREELLKMFEVDSVRAFLELQHLDLLFPIRARGIWFKPTTEKR